MLKKFVCLKPESNINKFDSCVYVTNSKQPPHPKPLSEGEGLQMPFVLEPSPSERAG
jgi:hypothetical protein